MKRNRKAWHLHPIYKMLAQFVDESIYIRESVAHVQASLLEQSVNCRQVVHSLISRVLSWNLRVKFTTLKGFLCKWNENAVFKASKPVSGTVNIGGLCHTAPSPFLQKWHKLQSPFYTRQCAESRAKQALAYRQWFELIPQKMWLQQVELSM